MKDQRLGQWVVVLMMLFWLPALGIGQSAPGDIAFTAFNADGDDDFSIVALVDISANSTIYISDNEPNADGSGFFDFNEGSLEWTTGGSIISVGTIVVFTDTDSNTNPSFGVSVGSLATASFDAGLNLSGGGDALYAVIGSPDGNNITAWLAGIQNGAGNEGANFNQTGLTSGSTFIDFYASGTPDGGYYSGARTGESSFSDYLALLGNSSNWTEEGSNGELTLPISTTAFSVEASLPVELSTWTATSTRGQVVLNWTTESEIENQGFIVNKRLESETSLKELASFISHGDLRGHGSTTNQNSYNFVDKNVEVGQTYFYQLSDVDYTGKLTKHAEIKVTVRAIEGDLKPGSLILQPAYPNPFNPVTSISFSLSMETTHMTTLEVYNLNGRLVETLYADVAEPGTHTAKWDASNVASGVYFIRLVSGNSTQIQRVSLLK